MRLNNGPAGPNPAEIEEEEEDDEDGGVVLVGQHAHGALASAIGAEGDEAVVQADWANPVAPPLLGRVFQTFPCLLFFISVIRH